MILSLCNFNIMNILLNIPDKVVTKYQDEADKEKRSRKNLMEKVLIDYFNVPELKFSVPQPKQTKASPQELKSEINYEKTTQASYDAPPVSHLTMDEIGTTPLPLNKEEIKKQIAGYEKELEGLGSGILAKQRRKFVELQLAKLKKEL